MQQSSRPMQLSTLDVTAQIRCDVAQFNSVFEPWTQEIQKELTRAESNHKQTIQQQKEELASSEEQIARFARIKAQQEKDTQAESARLAALDDELSQLTLESTSLPLAIQRLESELAQKQQQVARVEQEINALQQHHAVDLSTLRAASELVHASLGVTFVVSPDTGLRIAYKYISESRPERQYIVSIAVEGNKYVTRECSPLLPQLSLYLDQLNQPSAPFSRFVQRCRQGFKDLAKEQDQEQHQVLGA